ncbi:MAG: hypothetical protein QOD47_1169 [Gemmatimonadaceae bacterium]|jgi:hypothetical protein|nr:hypothetical protein [Gemmatimonadaceae bacterium]
MKPRSGLRGARAASCFFATVASDAESVRDFTIVSSTLSKPAPTSLQLRALAPTLAAQPERKSFDAALCGECETQLPGNFPFLATHAAASRGSASGRRETEYINAARDETATASSSNATSSSPITKPRRLRFPERCSPGTSTAPSCRPMYCAESPGRPSSCSPWQLRTS